MQHEAKQPAAGTPGTTPRILAQRLGSALAALPSLRPAQWIALSVLAFSGVAAFGIAPNSTLDLPATTLVERTLPLPEVAAAPQGDAPYWREERVQRGDTIGSLLARAGVDDPAAMQFLRTDPRARPLYQLRPGRAVSVATDGEGRLGTLRFLANGGDLLVIARNADDAFEATTTAPTESVRLTLTAGEIQSSLFGAADAAGLPDATTIALAELFGGDIDFLRDLRKGDRFAVLYESRFVEGEPVGTGRIVAAEFENRGTRLTAYLWQDADGEDAWYTEDGRSTRKAFLRSPMEFSRITSGFTNARLHPIFGTWRAHKGVDYAAPTGTPVRATADGIVNRIGWQNGYGNAIELRHHGAYTTLYAHLSRFAPSVTQGERVRQGETIGYVGSTGWATGPHLHYEFRVGNDARDPTSVALPVAGPLPAATRAEFLAHVGPLRGQLTLARDGVTGSRIASR